MIKAIFKTALAAGVCALIASCGNKSAEDNTLKIMLPGERPAFFDEVTEEAEKRLSNAGAGVYDLRFEFVPEDEYSDTLYVKLLAGGEYDIVCSLSENEFESYRDMEITLPLEDYILKSDKYPNLKELYPQSLWNAQENRYGGIYGIPSFNMYCINIDCLYYRSDLAKSDLIDSEEQLYKYLDRCADEGLASVAVSRNAGVSAVFEDDRAKLLENHVVRFDNAGYEAYILLDENNQKVTDIAFINEPEPKNGILKDLAARRREAYEKMFSLSRAAKEGGIDDFANGNSGAFLGYITGYAAAASKMGTRTMAAVVPFSLADSELYTDFTADCYNFIPFTSKKTEKALSFLEWLASDIENQYLFERGIEGKTWERLPDNRYRLLNLGYNFRGKFLLDNPKRKMLLDLIPGDIAALRRRAEELDGYIISPLAGFRFDTSEVSKQVSRTKNVMTNDKRLDYCNGRIENPKSEMLSDYEKLSQAQEDIKTELKAQVEYFLENGRNKAAEGE